MSDDPVPVARTQDEAVAHLWVDLLLDGGISAVTYRQGISNVLGGGTFLNPDNVVVVPRSEFANAREVILHVGGEENLLAEPAERDLSRATGAIFLLGGVIVASLLAAIAWRALI